MTRAAFALTLLIVLAGCAGVAPPTDRGAETADRIGAATAPEDFSDPPADRLGWENGRWYNEPLSIDASDGLNESEQEAVVARTMARVEYIRGLEFHMSVPVRVISREEFKRRAANRSTSAPRRQFDNAKFEALFLINESADSIAVQNTNTGSSVGGYYTPRNGEIVIVGDGPAALLLNEQTLAHELTHAVQDQQFDIGRYDRRTRDGRNALSGLIEGDAHYVGYLYGQRCGKGWECLEEQQSGGDGGSLANVGAYLLKYQPYSDGPTFVRHLYRDGGWSRVNAAYDDPPVSTEQTIHPERYPEDAPVHPTVQDRTRESWERIPVEGRPNYGELGEAGTNVMLVAPLFDSGGRTQVIGAREFFNARGGDGRSLDPYNYDHYYTDGIRGDRLVPYRNDANETGYVWKFDFDDRSQAREFRRGYVQVLEYRNATVVESATGPGTVYRIPEGDRNGFSDAFRVVQNDNVLVVTNAPTVKQLTDVRKPA